LALRYARSALDIAEAGGWTGWRLASCHEGMARAYATAGDRAARDRHVALARAALRGADDPGDRELIESQLAPCPETGFYFTVTARPWVMATAMPQGTAQATSAASHTPPTRARAASPTRAGAVA